VQGGQIDAARVGGFVADRVRVHVVADQPAGVRVEAEHQDPAGTNLGDGGVGLVSGARVVHQLTRCARPGTPGVPQDGADGSTAVGEVAGQVAVGEEDVPVPQDLGVGGGSHQVDLLRHRPG